MARLWSNMNYQGDSIGDALFSIGSSLVEAENKSRYNSEVAGAEAERLRLENQLWSDFDAATNAEEREDIWSKFENDDNKSIVEGTSKIARRDIELDLPVWKERLKGQYQKYSEQKDSQDSVINFEAAMTQFDNVDARDATDLTKRSSERGLLIKNMLDAGDHKDVQTESQAIEYWDKKDSDDLISFLAIPGNADRVNEDGTIDEGYWIEHPNEFAKLHDIGTQLDRPLLNAEEKAKLVTTHKFYKNINDTKQNEAIEADTTEALKLAVDGNMDAAFTKAKEMLDKYPSGNFIDVLNNIRNATSILSKGGPNYYEITGSPAKAFELQVRAEDTFAGKDNLTVSELRPWVGKEDGINTAKYTSIKKIITGGPTAKGFEDSVAAKVLKDIIAVDWPEKDEPEMYNFAADKYLGILQDWIADNPDATDREKKEQALRIGRQFEREDLSGVLGTELESKIGLPKPKRSQWKFGLEEIWDKLDAESRKAAVDLLDKGATPAQLIAHYKSKK